MQRRVFLPEEGLHLKSGGREAEIHNFSLFLWFVSPLGGRLADYNLDVTLQETRKFSEFLWNA